MRLDHFLLSPDVAERLVDGGVDRWVRGEENASDHAPAWIELQNAEVAEYVQATALNTSNSAARLADGRFLSGLSAGRDARR